MICTLLNISQYEIFHNNNQARSHCYTTVFNVGHSGVLDNMSYENIQFVVDGALATLTLDRPDKFNSFNGDMHAEVRDALQRIDDNDNIRCLLLTGNGRAFCAGKTGDYREGVTEKIEKRAPAVHRELIMQSRDSCTDMLGIECVEIGDENATFRMKITGDMLNMHKTCHGGMIFTLADTAFAFACNSDERAAVAQGANIDYIEPAYEGDVLVATARSRIQNKRTGLYDIEVRNQSDRLVAIFIGKAFTIRSQKGGD